MKKKNYLLENFVQGESNRVAYECAKKLARDEWEAPMVAFYGNPGNGKTHLAHAVGNALQENGVKVAYVEKLKLLPYAGRMKKKSKKAFLEEYYKEILSADVIIIEHLDWVLQELDFCSFREYRMGVYLQTFLLEMITEVIDTGKHILFTTTEKISKLTDSDGPLRAKFWTAIQVEVEEPDTELKMKFMESDCQLLKLPVPKETMKVIAEYCDSIAILKGIWETVKEYYEDNFELMDVEELLEKLGPGKTRIKKATKMIFDEAQYDDEFIAKSCRLKESQIRDLRIDFIEDYQQHFIRRRDEKGPQLLRLFWGMDETRVHSIEEICKEMKVSERYVKRQLEDCLQSAEHEFRIILKK